MWGLNTTSRLTIEEVFFFSVLIEDGEDTEKKLIVDRMGVFVESRLMSMQMPLLVREKQADVC